MTLVTSFEELVRETGREEVVLRQLTHKLGHLLEDVTARIAALDSATMLLPADALLDFTTQEDLRAWLDRSPGAPSSDSSAEPDAAA